MQAHWIPATSPRSHRVAFLGNSAELLQSTYSKTLQNTEASLAAGRKLPSDIFIQGISQISAKSLKHVTEKHSKGKPHVLPELQLAAWDLDGSFEPTLLQPFPLLSL